MKEEKRCLECGDVIKGRADKKFCDDQCRSNYNMAIGAVFLPVAFALRGSGVYRVVVLRVGSAAAALVAVAWMIERMFDLKLMPF